MTEVEEVQDGGFTTSDGVALVAGAAVAAVHLRVVSRGEGFGPDWSLVWGTFLWLALTAAGPFVYVVRRFGRGTMRHPQVGERLWALLGLPWLIAAMLPRNPTLDEPMIPEPLFAGFLSISLGIVCVIALTAVWGTWVVVPPERATATFSGPWTNRLGLILAIAWPFQCGLGLVVLG
ncbi:MAG: hypothetical protein AB7I30_15980 [Isosphaeraceae bacterium]